MTMGLERFQELVDAYGADPQRWPQAERVAAEALLAAEPQAQLIQKAAAELDALLGSVVMPDPSEVLRHRVLRAAPRKPAVIGRLGWVSGAGWAAAAAAGVLVGVSVGEQINQVWQADAVLEQAAAWGADEAEYFG